MNSVYHNTPKREIKLEHTVGDVRRPLIHVSLDDVLDYLEELESEAKFDRESLMRLISIRNAFSIRQSIRKDVDYPIDVYKRNASLQSIRRILTTDPSDPVALTLLRWTLTYSDDEVQKLNLDLKIHELDSDCPATLWLFPDSTFRRTNVIVDNWLASDGSGSELNKEEIESLLLRVQDRLLDAYDQLIDQAEVKQKLHWALDSVHDAILARKFENFQQISRRLDIGLEDHVEKRSAYLIKSLSREYDVDSKHGRSNSLSAACSNHGFELGLLDHCLTLLKFFGRQDSDRLKSPAIDWTRATISVMNALTRDCSGEYPLEFLFVPFWWDERRCFAEHHQRLDSNINELLRGFSEFGTSAEREVLEAYLRLDETSDEHFRRALDMDAAMVIYAAPLSQRLHRLGLLDAASHILANIDVKMRDQLTSYEEDFLNHVSNSVKDGVYENWDESAVDFQGTASPG